MLSKYCFLSVNIWSPQLIFSMFPGATRLSSQLSTAFHGLAPCKASHPQQLPTRARHLTVDDRRCWTEQRENGSSRNFLEARRATVIYHTNRSAGETPGWWQAEVPGSQTKTGGGGRAFPHRLGRAVAPQSLPVLLSWAEADTVGWANGE